MTKKLIAALLLSTTLLTACGTTATSNIASSAESSSTESIGETLEAVADVDKGLLDVTLTIPSTYAGEDIDQTSLDETCSELGYKSITLNEDGSVTYVMTNKQHQELLDNLQVEINSQLQDLIGSDRYPNFTAIEVNADFTDFTVTTKSTELDTDESISPILFFIYTGMYSSFSGTDVKDATITFVNADTGDIISTESLADWANQ